MMHLYEQAQRIYNIYSGKFQNSKNARDYGGTIIDGVAILDQDDSRSFQQSATFNAEFLGSHPTCTDVPVKAYFEMLLTLLAQLMLDDWQDQEYVFAVKMLENWSFRFKFSILDTDGFLLKELDIDYLDTLDPLAVTSKRL